MIKTKKVITLKFCPRCKEDFEGMMTRIIHNVTFCYLCSFDAEDEGSVRQWVAWAKDYKKNMMPEE